MDVKGKNHFIIFRVYVTLRVISKPYKYGESVQPLMEETHSDRTIRIKVIQNNCIITVVMLNNQPNHLKDTAGEEEARISIAI